MTINLVNWNFNSLIESGFPVALSKIQAFNRLLETTSPTQTSSQVRYLIKKKLTKNKLIHLDICFPTVGPVASTEGNRKETWDELPAEEATKCLASTPC